MKKKPMLTLLTVAAFAACLACIGCNNHGGGNGGRPEPPAPEFKGDSLTEEQWIQAVNYSTYSDENYTVDTVCSGTVNYVRRDSRDGVKNYYSSQSDKELVEGYACETDGEYFIYFFDESWEMRQASEMEISMLRAIPFRHTPLLCSYSDFTYDETTGAYEYNAEHYSSLISAEITFKNRKIVKLNYSEYADPEFMDESNIDTYTVSYSYGNADITLPEVTPPEITEPDATGFEFALNADESGYAVTGKGSVNVKNIEIPARHEDKPVTEIADGAFYDDDIIESVVLPDGVTGIGSSAFWSCGNLKSVQLSNTLTEIKQNAFQFCDGLQSVTASVITLCGIKFGNAYSNPLYYAHSLTENGRHVTEVEIPQSIEKIGNYSFAGADIRTVIIHDDVSEIGDGAFMDCNLLASVSLGTGLMKYGKSVFQGCGEIEYTEYENGLYLGNEDNPYTVLVKAKNTQITSCTINVATEFISNNAFRDCSCLTAVTIPFIVTDVGETAFANCTALKSVNYNARAVTTTYNSLLKSSPFNGCSALESIVVGSKVSYLPKLMFSNCGVVNLTFEGSATTIRAGAFEGCGNLTEISFLNGTKAQWENLTATGWDRNVGNYTVHCSDGDINK